MTTQTSAYTITFDPARAQYCVTGPRGLRVYPMPQVRDADCAERAAKLAEVLNRMERAPEPTPDIPPDYCASCDMAVYAIYMTTRHEYRCPECGAQVAEGSAI